MKRVRLHLLAGLCCAMLLPLSFAHAQDGEPNPAGLDRIVEFSIEPQGLDTAMVEFANQSGIQVVTPGEEIARMTSPGVTGSHPISVALDRLLEGTAIEYEAVGDGTIALTGPGLNGAAVAGQNTIGQRRPGIEEIIVTGQKREERIQDVPIAISAFSMEDLKTSQIAGGPDLHLQVPNMTFTKTNFTGYSIQIRGIGTQAISATTDPAVAVAMNNTPFIRNTFFEQEFYDLERVEVLRGPQGTLFGRNATAGVVNLITAKPKFQEESMLSLDMGNYNSRRWEFMLNQPLVEDTVALRVAGAGTKRDGYATNEITGNPIDGRDLWSTRTSLRIAPPDGRFDMNLIWEHFEEDDDRLRSGKQLCKKDVVTEVGGFPIAFSQSLPDDGQGGFPAQSTFSQGCERESLYSAESYQTPNGLSVPYYFPLGFIGLPTARLDPYVDAFQSKDLRVIESTVDPKYRAKSDIGQIQISYELTDTLTLDSETAYGTHLVYSLQDFNRYNTAPGAWNAGTEGTDGVDENGVFCDPQIGCSDRLVAIDVSTGESTQFSQELRLSSQFSGPLNFSLGANFLRSDVMDKYYVFINSITLSRVGDPFGSFDTRQPHPQTWVPGVSDNRQCLKNDFLPPDPAEQAGYLCVYIEPNSIENIQDKGHNYFLSKNPYRLLSHALFGELYWNVTDTLKLTAGLRWSVDKKRAPRIPSQIFAGNSVGHPTLEVIDQTWREPTGRLVLDWSPNLAFTDESMFYASYARGYKAGGANPPPMTLIATGRFGGTPASVTRPTTFDAEFVNAYEVGTKNTLFDGAVTLNASAFYYDYTGYQVSEIVDRSAFNRNFDLDVWGAEIETDWWVTQNFRLGFKGGYEKTRLEDGEKAVDLMDRTAGNEDWLVIRPFPTSASSCILPVYVYAWPNGLQGPGSPSGGGGGGCELAYLGGVDPVTEEEYEPNPNVPGYPGYPGFDPRDESQGHNNGEGFFKDLSGNELPNAPNWTTTLTADYVVPLKGDWLATLHTDIYWQSESWWRVFNDHEFNRLDDYFTMNLAAIFKNEASGWDIMAYVKNVTDEDAITGAFLNSDDTALTTNVFLVEPRLYGVRVTKQWDSGGGGPTEWLGGAGAALLGKKPGEPSPWELTVGGYLLRPNEARVETYAPEFITNFDPNIDPTGEQGGDFDWGDGREIVLTYRPWDGWRFSLGARFGESDRTESTVYEGETIKGCTTALPCTPTGYSYRTNYSRTDVTETEEHLLVDFMVGRDVGLGGFLEGTASAGLRYARLESNTTAYIAGTPDWTFPPEDLIKYQGQHTEYAASMEADREFEGIGPVVAWEASNRLFGEDQGGHVTLDWSVSGGVLFGKQKTSVEGFEESTYYEGYILDGGGTHTPLDHSSASVNHERSESVRVPTAGASLGLSYRIGGASIGAGYKWERYFDAIDGGVEERREYDRTIDGPYLKVTFGGE